MKEKFGFMNIDIDNVGSIKRIEYKTLRGFIREIKRINKIYKDRRISGVFTIKLPIKS